MPQNKCNATQRCDNSLLYRSIVDTTIMTLDEVIPLGGMSSVSDMNMSLGMQ